MVGSLWLKPVGAVGPTELPQATGHKPQAILGSMSQRYLRRLGVKRRSGFFRGTLRRSRSVRRLKRRRSWSWFSTAALLSLCVQGYGAGHYSQDVPHRQEIYWVAAAGARQPARNVDFRDRPGNLRQFHRDRPRPKLRGKPLLPRSAGSLHPQSGRAQRRKRPLRGRRWR